MKKHNKLSTKRQKGITLLSLIVTIILLLIISGVTIGAISGDNGIISKTKEATRQARLSQITEQIRMDIAEAYLEAEMSGESEISQDKIKEIAEKYRKDK